MRIGITEIKRPAVDSKEAEPVIKDSLVKKPVAKTHKGKAKRGKT